MVRPGRVGRQPHQHQQPQRTRRHQGPGRERAPQAGQCGQGVVALRLRRHAQTAAHQAAHVATPGGVAGTAAGPAGVLQEPGDLGQVIELAVEGLIPGFEAITGRHQRQQRHQYCQAESAGAQAEAPCQHRAAGAQAQLHQHAGRQTDRRDGDDQHRPLVFTEPQAQAEGRDDGGGQRQIGAQRQPGVLPAVQAPGQQHAGRQAQQLDAERRPEGKPAAAHGRLGQPMRSAAQRLGQARQQVQLVPPMQRRDQRYEAQQRHGGKADAPAHRLGLPKCQDTQHAKHHRIAR